MRAVEPQMMVAVAMSAHSLDLSSSNYWCCSCVHHLVALPRPPQMHAHPECTRLTPLSMLAPGAEAKTSSRVHPLLHRHHHRGADPKAQGEGQGGHCSQVSICLSKLYRHSLNLSAGGQTTQHHARRLLKEQLRQSKLLQEKVQKHAHYLSHALGPLILVQTFASSVAEHGRGAAQRAS